MNIIIRTATECDAKNIAAAEAEYIDCPWTFAQVRDAILAGAPFFVAESDGEFAGYISGDIAADECEMSNIAVVEKFRRNGIGNKLVKALISALQKKGVTAVFLLVREDNTCAQALYGKCGFEIAGKRRGYYKGKFDALIMKLLL